MCTIPQQRRAHVALVLWLAATSCSDHPATADLVQAASPDPADVRLHEIGPTAWDPFAAWNLQRADGPPIDVYVARRSGRRPALLLLPGSKCLPLFWTMPGRRISPLFLQGAVPSIVGEVSVVAFDRRGLRSFGPPPASEEEARALARCTPEHGGVSKVERVDDATAVAEALLAQPWVSELWILGHSEGGDVAAGVTRRLGPRVSAVALFAGAGITRFFEQSVLARREGGSLGAAAVLQDLVALSERPPLSATDDVDAIQSWTYGVESTPLDDLRGLTVPVFVAQGDADDKVPVETADAFVAELLRERDRSVRYVVFPGCDHGFFDGEGVDRSEVALREFLAWARTSAKSRAVVVWRPDSAAP